MVSHEEVSHEEVLAGQAVYTQWTLPLYDLVVHGVSNHLIWQCSSRRLLSHYNQHVSENHADVGVGTGYFLDRCRFPGHQPRVTLIDLNHQSLDHTSKRIARYRPATIQHDVLQPLPDFLKGFESVGMNYLLHCLPGTVETKSIVFDHFASRMNPGARLFGATILGRGIERSPLARRLMGYYNRRRIFFNRNDSLDQLIRELERRFDRVSVETEGCVALFSATHAGQ